MSEFFLIKNLSTHETIFYSQRENDLNVGFDVFLKLCKIKFGTRKYEKMTKIDFQKAKRKKTKINYGTPQGILEFSIVEQKPEFEIEKNSKLYKKSFQFYFREKKNLKKNEKKTTLVLPNEKKQKKENAFLLDFFVKQENNFSKIEQFKIYDLKKQTVLSLLNFNDFDIFFNSIENSIIYVNSLSIFFTFLKNSSFFKENYLKILASGKQNGNTFEIFTVFFKGNIEFKSTDKISIDCDVWNFSNFENEKYFEKFKKIKNFQDCKILTPLNLLEKEKDLNFDEKIKKSSYIFSKNENKLICENWGIFKNANYNGFLFLNQKKQFQNIENVVNFDLKKAYPAAALIFSFPKKWKNTIELPDFTDFKKNKTVEHFSVYGDFVEIVDELDEHSLYDWNFEVFKKINAKNQEFFLNQISKEKKYNDDFIVDFFIKKQNSLFPNHFVGNFELKNVILKEEGFPFLQKSKNTNIIFEKEKCFGVSVFFAKKIQITMTEIFYFLLLQNYDFEIEKITDFVFSNLSEKKHQFSRKKIEKCLGNDEKALLNTVAFGREISGCRGVKNFNYDKKSDSFFCEKITFYPEKKIYNTHFSDGIYTTDFVKLKMYVAFKFLKVKPQELIYADTDGFFLENKKTYFEKMKNFNNLCVCDFLKEKNIGFFKTQKYSIIKFLNYKTYCGLSEKKIILKASGGKIDNILIILKKFQKENDLTDSDLIKKINPFFVFDGKKINNFYLKTFENFQGFSEQKQLYSGCLKKYKPFSFFSFETIADFKYFCQIEKMQGKKYEKKQIFL